MSESPIIGLRIPPELLQKIDDLVGTIGKNRSEVILKLIKLSLGLESRKDNTVSLQQVNQLEKKSSPC